MKPTPIVPSAEEVLSEDPVLKQILLLGKEYNSDFTFRYRRESKLLMFLTPFMKRVNPNWDYITVSLGSNSYLPDHFFAAALLGETELCASTLVHETIHALDEAVAGRLVFRFQYAFPQILSLLSLLALGAFWSLSFLWALLFLGFLAPWPAPWRAKYESRAYAATMAVLYWMTGQPNYVYADSVVHILKGVTYYCCDWNPKDTVSKYMAVLQEPSLDSTTVLNSPYMNAVEKLLKEQK